MIQSLEPPSPPPPPLQPSRLPALNSPHLTAHLTRSPLSPLGICSSLASRTHICLVPSPSTVISLASAPAQTFLSVLCWFLPISLTSEHWRAPGLSSQTSALHLLPKRAHPVHGFPPCHVLLTLRYMSPASLLGLQMCNSLQHVHFGFLAGILKIAWSNPHFSPSLSHPVFPSAANGTFILSVARPRVPMSICLLSFVHTLCYFSVNHFGSTFKNIS